MNRRGFLRGLGAAAVAVPAVALLPSDSVEWVHRVTTPDGRVFRNGVEMTHFGDASTYYDGAQWSGPDIARMKHQREASEWLREVVDNAAFNMMTGRSV